MNSKVESSENQLNNLSESQQEELNRLLAGLQAGQLPAVATIKQIAEYAYYSAAIDLIIPVLVRDWRLNDTERLSVQYTLAQATRARSVWQPSLYTNTDNSPNDPGQATPSKPRRDHVPPERRQDPTTSDRETRIDPEIGRLAAALRRDQQLRLWAILRDAGAGQGGWLERDRLYKLLCNHTEYTKRHFNRLIAAGDGVFWHVWTHDRVGLAGAAKVGAALVQEAYSVNPQLVATNKPGRLPMLVPLGRDLVHWRAHLYGAWLAMKQDAQLARDTLARLFNVSVQTLRNWELINPRIRIQTNYGQAVLDSDQDADRLMDYLPSNPSLKREFTWQGEILMTWQVVNTYHASYSQCQGRTRAQARRAVAKRAIPERPALNRDSGQRWHYATAAALRKAQRRTGQGAGLVWRGENRRGSGIWELSTGEVITGALSRARGLLRAKFRADYLATLNLIKSKIRSGHFFDPLSRREKRSGGLGPDRRIMPDLAGSHAPGRGGPGGEPGANRPNLRGATC